MALAKARIGRPEFPHDQVAYEAVCAAVASGQVIVLLSAITYQELSRTGSLRQRTYLADVIAEISGTIQFGKDYKNKRRLSIVPASSKQEPVEYLIPKNLHVYVQDGDLR